MAPLVKQPALPWFLLSSSFDSSVWLSREKKFGGTYVTCTVVINNFHLNSCVVRMQGTQLTGFLICLIWF